MYTHILVPVDLAEKDKQASALKVAADLSKHYDARLTLVSVTGGLQAEVSHSKDKYAGLLAEFAAELAEAEGIKVQSQVYDTPDPGVEVDRKLLLAIEEIGVDLVVMASHRPGWTEYLFNSHGGRLASHAPVSVFLVRDPD